MKILESFINNFDSTGYEKKEIKDCNNNEKVVLEGNLSLDLKKTKQGNPYFNLVLKDNSGKINSAVWNSSDLYPFLNISKDGDFARIYGEVSVGRYTNINIVNIEFLEGENKEDNDILSIEKLKEELDKRLNFISNEYLKEIINLAIKECNNFEKTPFTEKTAYNYAGGLMHSIIDSCDFISSICDSVNCGFWVGSTFLNEDLLFTASFLSNLGKTETLQIDESGKISKTFKGQLDEDAIYSREIATKAVYKVLEKIKEEDGQIKEYEELFIELLHMVASAKNNTNWGALSTPKSKHALILSHINNLVYTKGLFENLEKNNSSTFGKPYDNSRNYFLGNYSRKE